MALGDVIPIAALIDDLKAKVDQLKQTVPIDCVFLYGSYAKGCPKEYSDIDLAVISPAFGKDIIGEGVALIEAFREVSSLVESRAYSREKYESAEPGTFLHDEIIKKGIRIC
jgi:predicted nucleotidyltransferase